MSQIQWQDFPTIPNLLSLRGGRFGRSRGGGGRGRGGGFPGGGGGGGSSGVAHDATIQGTDTDASVSRLSAVDAGYLEDPFAQYFVAPGHLPTRRLPIINRACIYPLPASGIKLFYKTEFVPGGRIKEKKRNRTLGRSLKKLANLLSWDITGTYTRTMALDRLVSQFLSGSNSPGSEDDRAGGGGPRRQIVSLGAGTDTRPFRLFSQLGARGLVYHEVDFPPIAAKKRTTVQAVPILRSIIPPPPAPAHAGPAAPGSDISSWSSTNLTNDCEYWCHGLDLRDLAAPPQEQQPHPGFRDGNADGAAPLRSSSSSSSSLRPLLPGIRPDLPTLLISECCLCYLEPADARAVIAHLASRIQGGLGIALYEPVRPHDPFGRQMVANLAARRIRMPTLDVYREVADQVTRLESAGFGGDGGGGVRAITIADAWRSWIPAAEKERVDALEGLDEVEEWDLLAGHYVVAWGWTAKGFEGWEADTQR
ncbi:S-adenosyl-L-methionine-dependent methyltransferase [Xylariales sp. PMI_506]|nr:S-adenosyl-L-methionine-dependent methyltransferase [Xylariales sp. PMI_506]